MKSRIASYCNANDTFCDSGSSLPVHLSYVQNNGTSAVNFIVQKVKSGSSSSTSSNSSSSRGGGTVTTNAATSDLHWGGRVFTVGLGVVSLGLGFLFVA